MFAVLPLWFSVVLCVLCVNQTQPARPELINSTQLTEYKLGNYNTNSYIYVSWLVWKHTDAFMIRIIFVIFIKHINHIFICGSLLMLQLSLNAQSGSNERKYFSIGTKKYGIGFGNSNHYNGIRLNLWDTYSENINGINFSAYLNNQNVNGIQFAALGSSSSRVNGLSIATFFNHVDKINGVATALFSGCDTINGLLVTFVVGKYRNSSPNKVLHGLVICGVNGYENVSGVSVALANITTSIKGLAIGGSNRSQTMHGIQIGLYNRADNLHGLQIGLINDAWSNPWWARRLPLVNFRM